MRLDLPGRWQLMSIEPPSSHPLRPQAYRTLTSPRWTQLFEEYDAGVTLLPLEIRYPLADLQLVDYLLGIPPVPWSVKKKLLRVTMRGILPEEVRLRPKVPLAGDPVVEYLRDPRADYLNYLEPAQELTKYVDRDRVPRSIGKNNPDESWINIRPFALNCWLQHNSNWRKENDYQISYNQIEQREALQNGLSQPPFAGLREYP